MLHCCFYNVHDSTSLDKRHLKINLRKLWLPIATPPFITVAPGELKIPVDTTCLQTGIRAVSLTIEGVVKNTTC